MIQLRKQYLGIISTVLGVVLFSLGNVYIASRGGSEKRTTLEGLVYLTGGVFCSAVRLALQESFLKKNLKIPPTLAVGVEGLFGLIVGVIQYNITNPTQGDSSYHLLVGRRRWLWVRGRVQDQAAEG